MNVALSRKRSRLAIDEDDDIPPRREPSPALSPLGDTLKKSKTQCELEELDIIRPEEAWHIDVDAILASNALASPPGSALEPHSNWAKYQRGASTTILCVQGNVQTHYELLCSALPDLYRIAPSLQAFVLCHDPSTHVLSPDAPFSLPLLQAASPPNNHFVRLGLLHPLGGGKFPLDALVVIDRHARRRLVLPFGWGAGKHATTPAGRSIQRGLMTLLRTCVEQLELDR
ncbi:uncharacterized protein SETTUDRAFT_166300 [Exserohilum turcica Et28A]|uniref:Uncharacterized protein n=1 Tax=Exserohilum turcicum (strain 28A) TaxID=671987 RepID=R0JX71_EXST2|nr:uncharacterized protein SETTUDRAFT_166300 [Exserohilum turcica Et28A]EOA80867.1 hypothetical protein SETTUDRAFT_166300 [Exserohilum turcica Et28A]